MRLTFCNLQNTLYLIGPLNQLEDMIQNMKQLIIVQKMYLKKCMCTLLNIVAHSSVQE